MESTVDGPLTPSDAVERSAAASGGFRDRLRRALVSPVDSAGLAVFRVGFGSLLAWEVWRAFDSGLIRADYDLPGYLFRWWLFEWVRPLPGPFIYVAFVVLGSAGALIALGFLYRPASVVACAGLAYWILLDKSSYLNHRYLAATLALLLIFVPAHAAYSLDARRKTSVRSRSVPAWSLWLIRFQVGAPYFFAGVAKLNFDWLFRAEPLKAALAANTDFPLIGSLFDSNSVAHVLAWGSAALDCTVVFLLLFRRTRVAAFALVLSFHFLNARLFDIGIFPWLMIVGTSVFFEPDWPRRMRESFRSGGRIVRTAVIGGFALGFLIGGFLPEDFAPLRALVGGFGVALLAYHLVPARLRAAPSIDERARSTSAFALRRPLAAVIAVWVVLQVLVPLRHFAIPGNVHWTEEGNRWAWHLLLRVKTAQLRFLVEEPLTGERWVEDVRNHLTPYQISKVRLPDMILQFAHYLKDHYADQARDVEVRVEAAARLNGRPPQWFIFPNRDLTQIPRPYIPPADWIEPLKPYKG